MNIFIAHINGNTAILTPEESWHCCKVLRKKSGDQISLIDGEGNSFEGKLEKVYEKQCTATIVSGPVVSPPRNYELHLAVAPTKQLDRIEWMIEKAVEIGINEISLFTSKNSERTNVKTERLKKIVESAVKQSLQSKIPKVNDLVTLKEVLSSVSADQKLMAHCFDTEKKKIHQIEFINKKTVILIGPEGDFTREEVDSGIKNGFTPVSLGETRLRTETAALYAVQAASLLSFEK